jgi:formylglycine-generating enzyme required for sulfatase activity
MSWPGLCVKVILQAQYVPDDPARQALVEWGGAWEDQRNWLATLALAMHEGGRAGAAVPEVRVREVLQRELAPTSVAQFLEAVRYRGGLLEERAELFQFVHLTFQEFLTARWLAKQRQTAWPHLQPHLTDAWWREVFLLTYGFAQMDHPPFAREYLEWLSTQTGPGAHRLAGLELAGAALLELERPDAEVRRHQAESLLRTLRDSTVFASGSQRVRAGDTLARLGDPRFRGDGALFLPDEPLLGFVEIPAGAFWMGSTQRDRMDYDNEKPRHRVTLPRYYIARYPVTVAQFRAFDEASGRKPNAALSLDGLPTHPVTDVSWYEALAYCDWLTGRLRTWEHTPEPLAALLRQEDWRVTLPSEAEWEKAARGKDGRVYPWGNDPNPDRANYDDTGTGTTSAVGCFPGGASPYGVEELSGNVWEWTRSLWGEYPYPSEQIARSKREDLQASENASRVLRGGAFRDDPQDVRCAYRNRRVARGVNFGIGFRVALAGPP